MILEQPDDEPVRKNEAILYIMDGVEKYDLVVSSPGYISRAVYHIRDRDRNFYMMGAYGCTLPFAVGLALNTTKKVIVIMGDGEAIASLHTFALVEKLRDDGYLSNLRIYVLNDSMYESTGGQPTIGNYQPFLLVLNSYNLNVINVIGDKPFPRIPLSPEKIKERFYNAINST